MFSQKKGKKSHVLLKKMLTILNILYLVNFDKENYTYNIKYSTNSVKKAKRNFSKPKNIKEKLEYKKKKLKKNCLVFHPLKLQNLPKKSQQLSQLNFAHFSKSLKLQTNKK